MPNDRYRSDKQRRFFHAAEQRGEISHASVARHDAASKGLHLPRYAHTGKSGEERLGRHHSPVGMRPHDNPAHHGLGNEAEGHDEELGAEHDEHTAGRGGFGGDHEDMGHLGGPPDEDDETEAKLAALKSIGHHARKALAMHLREKMPKQPEPEHEPMDAAGAAPHRSILEDDDREKAEKLKQLMLMHRD